MRFKTFVYDPPSDALEILYQDDAFLVLNKPSGLLTVPGRKVEHADSLASRAQKQFPQATIVHRLDMDTSGVLIMAMTPDVHRSLSMQFEKRRTRKEYIARVWGHMSQSTGEVDLPLICDWPNRPLQKVDHDQGKKAFTAWKVLEQEEQVTRVALFPKTGRTHQLRVHMAEIGHPILGDDFYANDDAFFAAKRLNLHAYKLMVFHPDDDREMWFEAPVGF